MTKDELLYFLKNPQQLSDLSYEKLKDLVAAHPFCQNFRFLIAKKSQLDQLPEYDPNLRMLATFVSNRSFLYKKLNHSSEKIQETFFQEDSVAESATESVTENLADEAEASTIPIESATPIEIIPPNEGKSDLSDQYAEHKSVELRITDSNDILAKKNLSSDLITQQEKIEKIVAIEHLEKKESLKKINKARISIKKEEEETVEEEEIFFIPEPIVRLNEVVEIESSEDEMPESVPDSSLFSSSIKPSIPSVIFEEEEIFFDDLKDSIPFEVTNEEDIIGEDIGYITDPTPKSSFNSWFDQLKEVKKKKKKKKKKADKQTENKNKLKTEKVKKNKDKDKDKDKDKTTKIKSDKKKGQKKSKKEEKKKKKSNPSAKKIDKSSKKKKKRNASVKSSKTSKKKGNKKKKDKSTKSFAHKSIVENESIASETLAELLADQGSPEKAIRMYERLSLIFPEKSTFFARRIEKLKKK